MKSLKQIAIIAGIGYLIIFITGIFSNFFVLENLIEPGKASITVRNITSNHVLFRVGILGFIIMVIFDLLLAWALYYLLKQVNKELSLLSGWLRLVNGTIFGVAVFNLFGVLQMLKNPDYMKEFDSGILNVQVMISLDAFNNIWLVGLIFFGLHLFLLGYLIINSGFIPKYIGYLLIVASFGYLADSISNFLLPNYADIKDIFLLIVVIPAVIGELSLTFWLLFRSSRFPENL